MRIAFFFLGSLAKNAESRIVKYFGADEKAFFNRRVLKECCKDRKVKCM